MKMTTFLMITMAFLTAHAQSTFKPLAGKFEVLSVSTDCSTRDASQCIHEGDTVVISSADDQAALTIFEKNSFKLKLQIIMKEYSWEDEGHFGYGKFEKEGSKISWSEASNSYGQHMIIQPKGNIYILEGKLRFSKYTPSFAYSYNLVLHHL